MDIPQMALKEVLFWAIAVVIGGIFAGAATSTGGIIIKRIFFKNGNDRRSADDGWFNELIGMHKSFLQSNQEVVGEIRDFSKALENLTSSLQRRSDRAFDEHADIIREVHRLDVPRKSVHVL